MDLYNMNTDKHHKQINKQRHWKYQITCERSWSYIWRVMLVLNQVNNIYSVTGWVWINTWAKLVFIFTFKNKHFYASILLNPKKFWTSLFLLILLHRKCQCKQFQIQNMQTLCINILLSNCSAAQRAKKTPFHGIPNKYSIVAKN